MPNKGRFLTSGSRRTLAATPHKLRKLMTGEVLVAEGDPAGVMYVVCTGSLRVFRRDPTAIDRMLEIASVGTGDVIGELGAILGQARTATVQALEPTQVLEISADQLPNLARQYQPLLRVIAAALRERTELPYMEIAEVRSGVAAPRLEGPCNLGTDAPRAAGCGPRDNGR